MGKSPHRARTRKQVTVLRAGRSHQGSGHWHVERRSTVIICRACHARIPRSLRPAFCPECGAGKR